MAPDLTQNRDLHSGSGQRKPFHWVLLHLEHDEIKNVKVGDKFTIIVERHQ